MPLGEGSHPQKGPPQLPSGHFWGLFRPLRAPRAPTSGFSLYDFGVC